MKLRAWTFVAAVLIVAVPDALAAYVFSPPFAGLTLLIAPLFAGLIAGKSGTMRHGAAACALGTLGVLLTDALATGRYPSGDLDLVPSAFIVLYSTGVGAFGAWFESHGRSSDRSQGSSAGGQKRT
jgi:hypothetical protein